MSEFPDAGTTAPTHPVPPPTPDEPTSTRPSTKRSLGGWAKDNLFPDTRNSVVSAIFGIVLIYAVIRAFTFVFITGRWEVLYRNVASILTGSFPREDLHLAWIGLFIVGAGLALMVGSAHQLVAQSDEEEGVLAKSTGLQISNAARRFAPLGLFIVVMLWLARVERFKAAGLIILLMAIMWGFRTFGMRLPHKRATSGALAGAALLMGGFIFLALNVWYEEWGGLLLTIFLASASITLCFPIGLMAALGRRSDLPVIRAFSVGYIELIRGVPLITLLFMGSLTLNFFLPEGIVPGGITRAIVVITLFSGAYVAEIVRGGLQAVPKGQSEAAMALGLPKTKEMRLIVLPQALRNVIPALVGQFISLFKDTSLVAIIGRRELLLVTQGLTKQPEFNGTGVEAEVLAIAAFIYWVIAFTMSRESQRLEGRLGVGTR